MSVVSFGLSDGELPNYVSLMMRVLTSGFSAILASDSWVATCIKVGLLYTLGLLPFSNLNIIIVVGLNEKNIYY